MIKTMQFSVLGFKLFEKGVLIKTRREVACHVVFSNRQAPEQIFKVHFDVISFGRCLPCSQSEKNGCNEFITILQHSHIFETISRIFSAVDSNHLHRNIVGLFCEKIW